VQLAQLYERRREGALDCSILVPVYNGARFIDESLPSVFAQNDVRAEIIISDDRSTDGSLERVLELARAYRGPHDVLVLRTGERAEFEHVPRLAERARAEVLIAAHQDDIAYPGRSRALLNAMQRKGVKLASSIADYRKDGDRLPPSQELLQRVRAFKNAEPFLYTGHDVLIGSRFAMHADLFRLFPKLERSHLSGGLDILLPIRALMIGEIARIERPLLQCELHHDRWSNKLWDMNRPETAAFGYALRRLAVLDCARRELDGAHKAGHVGAQRQQLLLRWLKRAHSHFAAELVKAREALLRAGFTMCWTPPAEDPPPG
jgi:hypothetical protein